jgi:hypothetical protein
MPRNRLDCAAASEIRLSHQGKDALGVVHRPGPLLTYQPMSGKASSEPVAGSTDGRCSAVCRASLSWQKNSYLSAAPQCFAS